MNAQAVRAATELADARPDVVATACLVAIMAQGPGFHCTAEDDITGALRAEGADAPVISSAGALLSGHRGARARRVAIVTPYMKPLTAAVVAYLEDAGVEVVDSLSLEVPDNLAVARLDPADLREHYQSPGPARVPTPWCSRAACRCPRCRRSSRCRTRWASRCSPRPPRRRSASSRSWAWRRACPARAHLLSGGVADPGASRAAA